MPILTEAQPFSRPIHDALAAGVDTLGQSQTVTFVPYVRTALPIDGFVFWVNAALLSEPDAALAGLTTRAPVVVPGSLHYASQGSQVEDETIVVRRVDFTAEQPIRAFAEVAPTVIYVGTWATQMGQFRFTFSARGAYYEEAGTSHYVGDAVYPAFEAQLIDQPGDFSDRQVVSNSMPAWLSMLKFPLFPSDICHVPQLQLYPAYLVPDNLLPAYGAVEISDTRALQAFPTIGPRSEHTQLCADRVRLTLYGLRNDEALDLLDYSLTYFEYADTLGLMNTPAVYDDHRHQIELAAIAMKKTVDFEVSYLQSRMREIARTYISKAIPSFYPTDFADYRATQPPYFPWGNSL